MTEETGHLSSWYTRNFVAHSSDESIAEGKISILAVVETLLSVAAYWLIWWWFDTTLHLLVSICVAPLTLLRSPASIETGIEMFQNYSDRDDSGAIRTKSRIAIAVFVSLYACLLIQGVILFMGVPPSNIPGSILVAAALVYLMSFLAGVVTYSYLDMDFETDFLLSGTIWTFVFPAAAVLFAINAWYSLAIIFVVLGCLSLIFRGTVRGIIQVPFLPALLLAFLFGTAIRTLCIRFSATLMHLAAGVKTIGRNWNSLILSTDFLKFPEIVPGLSESNPSDSLNRVFQDMKDDDNRWFKAFALLGIATLFLPSLLYRYSLKSTCWFYAPLIYVAHLPAKLRDGDERLLWIRMQLSRPVIWLRLALAILTLTLAVFAAIDPDKLGSLLQAMGAGDLPGNPFALAFVLDWSSFQPWHYFTLPSAILTLILFGQHSDLRARLTHGGAVDPFGVKVRALFAAERLRSLCVAGWLVLAFYYTAGWLYQCAGLTGWLARVFAMAYGPASCPT